MIGQKIGQYQLISVIGQGGMATVYKAYQPAFDRHVAIKVLGSQLSQDPTFVKRFQREAKVVARIEHRSIVPIYDYGEHDGVYYIVMRLIEGGTLRKKMYYEQISLPLAARVIEQVGEALDFAHQRNVIHRDLKPSNILLDERDNAYLTDFGIAKMLGSNTQVTASGVVGTPSYMSPEQCQGKTLGPSSDIYALGAILFEILTGKVPYEADTPLSVMYMHVREPIPSAIALNPKLPAAIDRVIVRALAKRPEERYPTAVALAAAFREIAGIAPPPKSPTRGLFSRPRQDKPQKPKTMPPPPAVAAAPQTIPHPIEAVGVEPDSPPTPTPLTVPLRKGLPKAAQSIMVGFGGMLLLVALVSAGLYGLEVFKSESSGALVPTLPTIGMTRTLFTPTSTGALSTLTPTTIVTSMIPSLSPAHTSAPSGTPTSAPSSTASPRPSMTPTVTLSPTATITLTPTITPVPGPTTPPGVLPPPGGGDRLAFTSTRYRDQDIFLIDIDRSNLRQVTNSSAQDSNPTWSPDGILIAFVSTRDGDAEIWAVAAGCTMLEPQDPPQGCEGNMVPLTSNNVEDFDPAWSPNGQQIAYASNQDGDYEIWVMQANGSNPHPITSNSADDFSPQWSPDGSQIVYWSKTGSTSHLYRISAAGSTPEQLTSSSAFDLWPDWSHGGSRVVYTSTSSEVSGALALFTFELDSALITPLLDGKYHDQYPAWAPSGQRLAFSSDREVNGRFDLFVLDLLSGNLQQLTFDAGNNDTPDWQPR
jgi:serine/threonine-protein kinase